MKDSGMELRKVMLKRLEEMEKKVGVGRYYKDDEKVGFKGQDGWHYVGWDDLERIEDFYNQFIQAINSLKKGDSVVDGRLGLSEEVEVVRVNKGRDGNVRSLTVRTFHNVRRRLDIINVALNGVVFGEYKWRYINACQMFLINEEEIEELKEMIGRWYGEK